MASIHVEVLFHTNVFYATIHPEDEPSVSATLENAIRTRTDYDHEFRDLSSRRQHQIPSCHRTIRSPSGEIGEYVGITMDITELKRAEEEREKIAAARGGSRAHSIA